MFNFGWVSVRWEGQATYTVFTKSMAYIIDGRDGHWVNRYSTAGMSWLYQS